MSPLKIASGDQEKVVLYRNSVPLRVVSPSPKPLSIWFGQSRGFTVKRWAIAEPFLLTPDSPEYLSLLAQPWMSGRFDEAVVGPKQRGILWEDGRVVRFLGPGRHAWWKTPRNLAVEILETSPVLCEHPNLVRLLAAKGASDVLHDFVVPQGAMGLLYVEGTFVRDLPPGRYALWRGAEAYHSFVRETRVQTLTLSGQELMTRDRLTLRLNVDVGWAYADLRKAFESAADAQAMLYNRAQLALREHVGAASLDELLDDKDGVSKALQAALAPFAESIGARVDYVGLRDVILPGELKTILNRVIEAKKSAEADAIKRREETASTRSMLNTARLIEENPTLLRLKEMESLREIMEKVQSLTVFDGLRGLLDGLKRDLPPPKAGDASDKA